MDREDIVRMAREANLHIMPGWLHAESVARNVECFAALVADAEREACAKVADAWDHDKRIAAAIRARES